MKSDETPLNHVKRVIGRAATPYGLLAPSMLFIGFLVVAALTLIRYSFNIWTYQTGITGQWTWSAINYIKCLTDPTFQASLLLTLRIAFTTTLSTLLLGYPLAYYMAKRSSANVRSIMTFILLMPLFTDVLVRSYGFVILLSRTGLVNDALSAIGLGRAPLMFSELSVTLACIHEAIGMMTLPILGVIEKIDRSMEEAARTLGANTIQTFLRVSLPLSIPGILAGSMLVFSLTMSAFVFPQILGGGRVNMVSMLVGLQIMTILNWPYGSAISTILVVFTLAILFVYVHVLRTRPS